VEVLCFVPLADRAALDVVVDALVVTGHEEGCTEALQCLLDALVAHAMGML
jgi:hypothetical protein